MRYQPQTVQYSEKVDLTSQGRIGGLEAEAKLSEFDPKLVSVAKDLHSRGINNLSGAQKFLKGAKFTLIELLVVVSIIALLAGILLPVLGKAMKKARKTACLNNEKQVLIGMMMYADENEGYVPRGPPVGSAAEANMYDTAIGTRSLGHFYTSKTVNSLQSFYCPDASFFTPTSTVGGIQNWGIGNVISSYIWRNTSGGNLSQRLEGISNPTEKAAFLDYNVQSNLGRYNHNIIWVNLAAYDGHAVGVDDTAQWSFSGGDRDVVFTEADKKLNK